MSQGEQDIKTANKNVKNNVNHIYRSHTDWKKSNAAWSEHLEVQIMTGYFSLGN